MKIYVKSRRTAVLRDTSCYPDKFIVRVEWFQTKFQWPENEGAPAVSAGAPSDRVRAMRRGRIPARLPAFGAVAAGRAGTGTRRPSGGIVSFRNTCPRPSDRHRGPRLQRRGGQVEEMPPDGRVGQLRRIVAGGAPGGYVVRSVMLARIGAVVLRRSRGSTPHVTTGALGVHVERARLPVGGRLAPVAAHVGAGESGGVERCRSGSCVVRGMDYRLAGRYPQRVLPRPRVGVVVVRVVRCAGGDGVAGGARVRHPRKRVVLGMPAGHVGERGSRRETGRGQASSVAGGAG